MLYFSNPINKLFDRSITIERWILALTWYFSRFPFLLIGKYASSSNSTLCYGSSSLSVWQREGLRRLGLTTGATRAKPPPHPLMASDLLLLLLRVSLANVAWICYDCLCVPSNTFTSTSILHPMPARLLSPTFDTIEQGYSLALIPTDTEQKRDKRINFYKLTPKRKILWTPLAKEKKITRNYINHRELTLPMSYNSIFKTLWPNSNTQAILILNS